MSTPLFPPPPAHLHLLLDVSVPPVAKAGDKCCRYRPAWIAQKKLPPRFQKGIQKAIKGAVVPAFVRDIGRDQTIAGFTDRVPPVEIGDLVIRPRPVPGGVVGGENQCVFDVISRFDAPAQARQRYADEPQSTAQLDHIRGWQTPFEQPSGKAQGGRPHLGPVRKPLMGIGGRDR